MYTLRDELTAALDEIREAGLYKTERELGTPRRRTSPPATGRR